MLQTTRTLAQALDIAGEAHHEVLMERSAGAEAARARSVAHLRELVADLTGWAPPAGDVEHHAMFNTVHAVCWLERPDFIGRLGRLGLAAPLGAHKVLAVAPCATCGTLAALGYVPTLADLGRIIDDRRMVPHVAPDGARCDGERVTPPPPRFVAYYVTEAADLPELLEELQTAGYYEPRITASHPAGWLITARHDGSDPSQPF